MECRCNHRIYLVERGHSRLRVVGLHLLRRELLCDLATVVNEVDLTYVTLDGPLSC